MQQDIDVEYERYKDWDFSNATPTKNPTILKLQARKQAYDRLMNMLDDDVQELITKHESPKNNAMINAVIRAVLTTA